MKQVYPWLILCCALGLAVTSAYYSISGLSQLFSGARIMVIIMVAFLELSKVSLTAVLYAYWKGLNKKLKTYLVAAVITISVITSIGVYGYLSAAYESVHTQYEQYENEQAFHEKQSNLYETQLMATQQNLNVLESDISTLRQALADNTIQYVSEDGQLITTTSRINREAYQHELQRALSDQAMFFAEIRGLHKNIITTNQQLLQLQQQNSIAVEVGPLIYLSRVLEQSMDYVVSYIILLLMFVFDPLALVMVIVALFALQHSQPKKENTKIQVTDDDVVKAFENNLGMQITQVLVEHGFMVDVKKKRWRKKGRSDWQEYRDLADLRVLLPYLKKND